MTATTMPQCLDPTSPLLPSAVITALTALVVVAFVVAFVVSEVRFFFRHHRLLSNATKIPVGPTAPYRDYADASDRTALLPVRRLNAGVSPGLEAILAKATHLNRDERYPSARAMSAALARLPAARQGGRR